MATQSIPQALWGLQPSDDDKDGPLVTLWLAGGQWITGNLDEVSEDLRSADLHQSEAGRWVRVSLDSVIAAAWPSGRC